MYETLLLLLLPKVHRRVRGQFHSNTATTEQPRKHCNHAQINHTISSKTSQPHRNHTITPKPLSSQTATKPYLHLNHASTPNIQQPHYNHTVTTPQPHSLHTFHNHESIRTTPQPHRERFVTYTQLYIELFASR